MKQDKVLGLYQGKDNEVIKHHKMKIKIARVA